MTDNEKDFVLAQPREIKLDVLRDLVKAGSFSAYFELAKILLNAPITEGGIESETIDTILKINANEGVDAAFKKSEDRIVALGKK